MILGFKTQFKPPILAGTKIHTIREDPYGRWRLGMPIQMATGVRTKSYNCFKEGSCTGVQRVFMTYDHMLHVSIENASGNFAFSELYFPEKDILAKNDGFATYEAFEEWFYNLIIKSPDKQYAGRIIHWTDFKY